MEYKVLALGDVASETGLQLLEKKLRAFKKEHDVRFTVVNGENISGSGLTKAQAEALFAAGADGFLRCGCAGIVAFFIAGKDMFELHHAGVGKHQGRVIIRNQRRGRDNFMVVFCEVIQKSASNVFQCCSHSNFISQMQFDLNLIFFRLFWDKSPANF